MEKLWNKSGKNYKDLHCIHYLLILSIQKVANFIQKFTEFVNLNFDNTYFFKNLAEVRKKAYNENMNSCMGEKYGLRFFKLYALPEKMRRRQN